MSIRPLTHSRNPLPLPSSLSEWAGSFPFYFKGKGEKSERGMGGLTHSLIIALLVKENTKKGWKEVRFLLHFLCEEMVGGEGMALLPYLSPSPPLRKELWSGG